MSLPHWASFLRRQHLPTDLSELHDSQSLRPVLGSVQAFSGRVWSIRSDTVDFEGVASVRDVLVHPGAVGIIALDEHERVLLIQQYRHPVGRLLWEAPAGLLDIPGESALECAQRELLEETGFLAWDWSVLVDFWNSPGGSTEAFRCYLARDLHLAPGGRPAGTAEEADLPIAWVSLDEVVAGALAGRLGNPTTVIGSLAAVAARDRNWTTLRSSQAAWSARPNAGGH